MKYFHTSNILSSLNVLSANVLTMTDDVVCLEYKTDAAQDVRRMEKFVTTLMRQMASEEHAQLKKET